MPLTPFQTAVAHLLSCNRTEDSYLAGGAAIHLKPNSVRYSNDLDYFNDSEERVATAWQADRDLLQGAGYSLRVLMQIPGFVRAVVQRDSEATKVEWAHDSAWRFMPTIKHEEFGFVLHDIDLAINKVLALAGRDELRDYIDILHLHKHVLSLAGMCWAAPAKDLGFTPTSLLTLLRRRGRHPAESFAAFRTEAPLDPAQMKEEWLLALDEAEAFARGQAPDEIGCLYFDTSKNQFVTPRADDSSSVVPHYGRPGGVLPLIK